MSGLINMYVRIGWLTERQCGEEALPAFLCSTVIPNLVTCQTNL